MKAKENAKKQDMGSDSIPKLLAQLAIPAVVAQVINLLYNIVDRIYIGHIPEIGASALTGVGLCLPILMLVNAFAMMVGTGGAPLAAIAMGKKDNERAEKIIGKNANNSFKFKIIGCKMKIIVRIKPKVLITVGEGVLRSYHTLRLNFIKILPPRNNFSCRGL